MDKKNDSRDFTWVNDDTDNEVYAADGEEAEDLFAAEEPRRQDQPIDLIYPDKSDAEKEEQDAHFRENREARPRNSTLMSPLYIGRSVMMADSRERR